MKRQWMLGAMVLLGAGCDVVLGIEGGIPIQDPVETPVCTVDADCPKTVNECTRNACISGMCQPQNIGYGTPVGADVPGDCKSTVCDGFGNAEDQPNITDFLDDGNPCTDDKCNGFEPQHPPRPNSSVPCYSGPPGTQGIGLCHGGVRECINGVLNSNCLGETTPASEVCLNGTDDDCDGNLDSAFDGCICGDGMITTGIGEECDDGSTADNDTCSSTCKKQEVLDVVGGHAHHCVRVSGGNVKCWGRDGFGELGIDTEQSIGDEPGEMGEGLLPVELAGRPVKQVSTGCADTCVIFEDGGVKCWGYNMNGQLGQGTTGSNWTASPGALPDIAIGEPAISIATALEHTCVLTASKQVKCWGYNAHGELGLSDGNNMNHPAPTNAIDFGGIPVEEISAGCGYHTCARLVDNSVKCWGYNASGQLGQNTTGNIGLYTVTKMKDIPAIVLGQPALALAVGGGHSCALLADNSLKCWGDNSFGQLGIGNNQGDNHAIGDQNNNEMFALKAIDVGLPLGTTITQISALGSHTCVRLSSGQVKCWGENVHGELGRGTTDNWGDGPNEMGPYLQPVNLGTGQFATKILAAPESTCAILAQGNVKCWGWNPCGKLGLELSQAIPFDSIGDQPNEVGDNIPTVKIFSNVW